MAKNIETKFLVITPLAFNKEAIKAVVINRLREKGIEAISTENDSSDGHNLIIEFAYSSGEALPPKVKEELKSAVSQAAQLKVMEPGEKK